MDARATDFFFLPNYMGQRHYRTRKSRAKERQETRRNRKRQQVTRREGSSQPVNTVEEAEKQEENPTTKKAAKATARAKKQAQRKFTSEGISKRTRNGEYVEAGFIRNPSVTNRGEAYRSSNGTRPAASRLRVNRQSTGDGRRTTVKKITN